MRQRITIQNKASVLQDGYGEETITWGDYHTCWAAVEPLRGSEYYEQEMAGADVSTRIVIRWPGSKTITPEMRVSFDGNYYDIESVIPVEERNREVQLMCRKVISEDWEGGD